MNDIVERAARLGVSVEVIERKQLGANAGTVTAFEAVLTDETRVAFSSEADLRAALRLQELLNRDKQPEAEGVHSAQPIAPAVVDETEEPDEQPAFSEPGDIAPQSIASGLSFAERQAQRMSNRPSVTAQPRTPNVKSPIVAQGRTLV